jgi:xanthine dehydrogenase accessory factor
MTGQAGDGWKILEKASELARQGEQFAIATVVWRQGPSSGHQGARAIITDSGEVHGWIGGACAEPVVIREAQKVMTAGEARAILLGAPEDFGHVPEGMMVVPMACQSEGAMQLYIEPVQSSLHLVVVGHSPMAATLVDLATVLGWRAELVEPEVFIANEVESESVVIVATQGHDDEDTLEHAVLADPAFVGLVASAKRGDAVLGYVTAKGVPTELAEKVRVPVGLDLGHTSHIEIAVAVLAELVELKAAGALNPSVSMTAASQPDTAVDPVCGMTVNADETSRPFEFEGTTYYFCAPGCRTAFEKSPHSFIEEEVA